ncbi:uncharacterized protein LOC116305392 [Actinia tenebrosa]|uniref:Uncharacterized protein LOC116305392 n=1 Tax=Actinia tenebrosa TaxID=6105 RepID=A0A6P8IV22_ACTTE|nr:uncharacterized protein LOC116305392 [Actinia tenebrosa]
MKIIAFVIFIGFCLSFVPFVISIKCIMCDPDYEATECKETYIDCSKDEELGKAFDSCFAYQMVIESPDGSNFTHLDKNCSISEGCDDLKNVMCDSTNHTLEGAVQSCDILCCEGDYCNLGESKFTKRPDTSTHTRATTQHNTDVLGYRSTASRHTGDKWKLVFGIFCPVIYSIVSRTLL